MVSDCVASVRPSCSLDMMLCQDFRGFESGQIGPCRASAFFVYIFGTSEHTLMSDKLRES